MPRRKSTKGTHNVPSAWTISSGSELVRGRSLDTNAAWLARRLAELGVPCARHVTVGDDLDDLCAALQQAAENADCVILTGGLGPTADDLTRAAFARVSGEPLELDAPSLAQIEAFFAARHRPMPERNKLQAMLPRGASAIPNPTGTAPGIRLWAGTAELFALPGVPHEMKVMFEADVAPALARLSQGQMLRYRCLHCYGMSESEIGTHLHDLMARGANPDVGTTASAGTIGIRIHAIGASTSQADEMLHLTEMEIRRRLGVVVFGKDDETLASVVGRLLKEAGKTLVTAESCTGGLVGTVLTDVPGSSAYYLGGVISYSNALKQQLLGVVAADLEQHGAVSEVVAMQMAVGARERFRADYALAITGIAGPDGGTTDKPVGLVCFAIADPQKTAVRTAHFGADSPRAIIRERAVGTVLNWLRLLLLEHQTSANAKV